MGCVQGSQIPHMQHAQIYPNHSEGLRKGGMTALSRQRATFSGCLGGVFSTTRFHTLDYITKASASQLPNIASIYQAHRLSQKGRATRRSYSTNQTFSSQTSSLLPNFPVTMPCRRYQIRPQQSRMTLTYTSVTRHGGFNCALSNTATLLLCVSFRVH